MIVFEQSKDNDMSESSITRQFWHSSISLNPNTQLSLNDNHQHDLDINHQSEQIIVKRPTEIQVNQYIKKTLLQTYLTNSHIDQVRTNYIKLKNKKHANTILNQNQKHLNSSSITQSLNNQSSIQNLSTKNSISNLYSKTSAINRYLIQLEQDSKKTSLPKQIIRNKTLCKLYQKLDLFQDNLISQNQKQQKMHKTTNEHHTSQLIGKTASIRLTQQQLQWQYKLEQQLKQANKKLSAKKDRFYLIQQQLSQQNRLNQIQASDAISEQRLRLILEETQGILLLAQQKLSNLEKKLSQLYCHQVKNKQIERKKQQLQRELKDLMCELSIRQNMF